MKVQIDIQTYGDCPRGLKRTLISAAKACLCALPKNKTRPFIKKTLRLSLLVVDETEMQKINKRHRKKNKPTDVLSFSRIEGDFPNWLEEIGDVVLCWPVALKQAKERGVSPSHEVKNLLVHGILHLFGYDHERSPKDEKIMFRLQAQILSKLLFLLIFML